MGVFRRVDCILIETYILPLLHVFSKLIHPSIYPILRRLSHHSTTLHYTNQNRMFIFCKCPKKNRHSYNYHKW